MALNTTPGDGCDSLCSVADADDYHAGRGNVAAWAPLETQRKEQLLRLAYEFLYGRYWATWPPGRPFGALADGVTVATGARSACALLALYAIDGPLDAEAAPQVIEKTVGPITTKYANAGLGGKPRGYPDVARLMAPYLARTNPYCVPLVRI